MVIYKIFIVEDDVGIGTGLATAAARWGYETRMANDLSSVTEEFVEYSPHLVILDISLPFFNGYHWCSEIRKISKVPIIFISSAADNMNIVMAMNLGADDFIPKPFDTNVLIAKIQALLRRTYDFSESSQIISHNGVFLNTGDQTVTFNGNKTELTKNEFRILLSLMENKDKVVSRGKLMEKLWETDCFVDENTLTVNINRLRRKLEIAGINDLIRTKFGEGYIIGGT